VRILFIDPKASFLSRARRLFRRDISGLGIDEHISTIRELSAGAVAPEVVRRAGKDVANVICEEASKGCELIIIGASQRGPLLGGPVLEDVVAQAPCHVAIVRDTSPETPFRKLIVLVDGSAVSRAAAEFAVRYCEVTESSLTLLVLTERPHQAGYIDESGRLMIRGAASLTREEALDRISPVFRASAVRPELLHLPPEGFRDAVLSEIRRGGYDLLVIGVENRAIRRRLFFGHDNERIIQNSPTSVAILVPHIGKLSIGPVESTSPSRGVNRTPASGAVASSAG
jgi:nucleotide-binding universal stress UspA family protein